ncbi:MAG: bis-adenosyl-polyphosphate hydrolase [Deltaproteobacteria bacterium]|nr:bis-adenosyl-polyphosphate hydrolase [Deltaproteobacteria bacterium]
MEYIAATKEPGEKKCFLCLDGNTDDESLVLGRLGKAFVIMNRFPYTNGHVMVVPVRHTGVMEDLSDEETLDMMRLVKVMVSVYKEEFSVEGVNVGINIGRAAGAGLEEHLHIHMVPRWFGDTNFMAVTGETRVISEHLMTSYERLKRKFREKVF